MSDMRFSLVNFDGTATITVFHNGEAYVATDTHPNWDAIIKGVTVDKDSKAVDLFDVTKTVARKFERLGTRVTAANNRLYHDGDEVDNSLARKILEFIEAGVDDWQPLVKFMEKVYDNPEEHSRQQLFDWLERHDFSINEDGDILGYKAVYKFDETPEHGHTYQSVTYGGNKVVVDGVEYTGRVPQSIGSVVEMPRSEVVFDPATGCAAGLHVSNFNYANGFHTGSTVILLVAVSPRDVVSVPTESNWEKVRVNRYRVVREEERTDARIETASPLFLEKPVAEGLALGDGVRLTKTHYYNSDGTVSSITLPSFGVNPGDEGTVSRLPDALVDDCIHENNVGVQFADIELYVAKDALVKTSPEPQPDFWYEDDEDDSWDSWDEDSWGL